MIHNYEEERLRRINNITSKHTHKRITGNSWWVCVCVCGIFILNWNEWRKLSSYPPPPHTPGGNFSIERGGEEGGATTASNHSSAFFVVVVVVAGWRHPNDEVDKRERAGPVYSIHFQ